jgi:hypothetical protein
LIVATVDHAALAAAVFLITTSVAVALRAY